MITTDQTADTVRPATIVPGPAPAAPAGRKTSIADPDGGTGEVVKPVIARTGTVVRRDREIVATTDTALDDLDLDSDGHVQPDDDYRRHGVEDPFDADRTERGPEGAEVVGELIPDPDNDRLLQLVHFDTAALETLTTGEWVFALPRRRRRRRVSAMPTLQTGATPPIFLLWLGHLPPQLPFPTTSAALHGSAVKLIGTGGQQHFHVLTDRQVWVRALNASGATGWVDVWEEAL